VGGRPAGLVDVQSGPEVGGAHPLDDCDPFRILDGGLSDLSGDSTERVLCAVEGEEVCPAGASVLVRRLISGLLS